MAELEQSAVPVVPPPPGPTPAQQVGGGLGVAGGMLGGGLLGGRLADAAEPAVAKGLNNLMHMGVQAEARQGSLLNQAILGGHSITDRLKHGPTLGAIRTMGRAAPDSLRAMIGRLARSAQGGRKGILQAGLAVPAMVGGGLLGGRGGVVLTDRIIPPTSNQVPKVARTKTAAEIVKLARAAKPRKTADDLSPGAMIAAQILAGLGGSALTGAAVSRGVGGKALPGAGAGVGGLMGGTAGTLLGGGIGALAGGGLAAVLRGDVDRGAMLGGVPGALAGGALGTFAGAGYGARLAGAKPAPKSPPKPRPAPPKGESSPASKPEPNPAEKTARVREFVADVALDRKIAHRYVRQTVRKVAAERAAAQLVDRLVGAAVLKRAALGRGK